MLFVSSLQRSSILQKMQILTELSLILNVHCFSSTLKASFEQLKTRKFIQPFRTNPTQALNTAAIVHIRVEWFILLFFGCRNREHGELSPPIVWYIERGGEKDWDIQRAAERAEEEGTGKFVLLNDWLLLRINYRNVNSFLFRVRNNSGSFCFKFLQH